MLIKLVWSEVMKNILLGRAHGLINYHGYSRGTGASLIFFPAVWLSSIRSIRGKFKISECTKCTLEVEVTTSFFVLLTTIISIYTQMYSPIILCYCLWCRSWWGDEYSSSSSSSSNHHHSAAQKRSPSAIIQKEEVVFHHLIQILKMMTKNIGILLKHSIKMHSIIK